jgi:hypothetical protein
MLRLCQAPALLSLGHTGVVSSRVWNLRRLLLPLIAGCAVLSFAAPASATPPEHFSFTESGTEVLAHCDGFDIILDTTGTFRGTAFFDKSGEVVKLIIHGRIEETMTNSVTGKYVVNRGVFQDFFTRIRGTDLLKHAVSGFDFQGKVAGRGPLVFQDVGRKVFLFNPETGEQELVFRSGHTTLPEASEAEAVFCASVS